MKVRNLVLAALIVFSLNGGRLFAMTQEEALQKIEQLVIQQQTQTQEQEKMSLEEQKQLQVEEKKESEDKEKTEDSDVEKETKEQATATLQSLIEKGVPVEFAYETVKKALQYRWQGQEIAELGKSIADAIDKGMYPGAATGIAQDLISNEYKVREMEQVMAQAGDLCAENASPRRIRRMVRTMLKNGASADELRAVMEQVKKEIQDGADPASTVKTATKLSCQQLRKGTRGQEFAAELSKEMKQFQARHQIRMRQREPLQNSEMREMMRERQQKRIYEAEKQMPGDEGTYDKDNYQYK